MKKLPVLVVFIGCIMSWILASLNPTTITVDNSTYSSFNYQLMAIGIALSLLVGIIMLWIVKRKG